MTQLLQRFKRALAQPAWICFTWFGMTAGVSLLATPVRFSAPTLSRAAAMDVGRVTFAALNKAELVALILLLIIVRMSGRALRWWGICGVLALIVLVQSIWLLPELTARAAMIVSGSEPPASWLHAAYSISELSKLGILFVAGFVALDERAREAEC